MKFALPVQSVVLVCVTLTAGIAFGESRIYSEPVRSGRCLSEGAFSCQYYEYTYRVRGASCTEDCLVLSNLNNCQLQNRCTWHPESGCFIKEVCIDISPMQTCRRWETQALCQ